MRALERVPCQAGGGQALQDAETIVMAMQRRVASLVRTVSAMAIAIGLPMLTPGGAYAQTTAPSVHGTVTLDQLQRMNSAEIEAVYRQGIATAIPAGRVRGAALLSPGTRRGRALSRGARLVWQGKVIEPDQTSAVNRFFGLRFRRAPRSTRDPVGSTVSLH